MDSLELIVTTKDGQTAACEIFYEYEGGSRGAN